MSRRVLHILSQRPLLTGSGITLDALVRSARDKGWDQHAIVAVPRGGTFPQVADLGRDRIHPVYFEDEKLNFPVPGMSDVMPYASTRFSAMSPDQITAYKNAWRHHIESVASNVTPDLIHSHHVWIMSSLIKQVLPNTPVVTHCHATGLRQMGLCPALRRDVVDGMKEIDRFVVLRKDHGEELARVLAIDEKYIRQVGAGYNDTIFHARGRRGMPTRVVYVGKLSKAKGLPWLLDAIEELSVGIPDLELHVVGAGAGKEAETIERRINSMSPMVKYWGQLSQTALADLLRTSALGVLPSFYEGVPLVLVEAMACGCRLVATRLPGVARELEPHLREALDTIPVPPLVGIDRLHPDGENGFVGSLKNAIGLALCKPPLDTENVSFALALAPFSWTAVFQRVETVWKDLIRSGCR